MDNTVKISAIRINKFLAEAGVCSRREADRLIEDGKVTINGEKAVLGAIASLKDTVKVHGKTVKPREQKLYIAFHKPFGVITTTDKNSTNTVMDYIKTPTRIYPVGRLDVHSSGLLLLTNDGDIVNKLNKAENKQEKEYLVTVNKPLKEEDLQKLQRGIMLDGRKTLPAKVKKISSNQMSITVIQGMNRQIRRMCEKVGYEVKILKRVRIGKIHLDALPRGKWRHLNENEIKDLKS